MVLDRWTPAEHSAFDRRINEGLPFSPIEKSRDLVLPNILTEIARLNNEELSLGDASELIQVKWLRDLLIQCREKGSFRDVRRLSESYTSL